MVKLGVLFLSLLSMAALGRAEENFEWNVLFKDWRNIGPFPIVQGGIEHDYLGWTGAPKEEEPVQSQGAAFHWRKLRAGNIYTKERPDNQPAVFYAAARVISPKKTEAILAFGAFQTVSVWHGNERIFDLPSKNRSRMDNYKVKVTLQPGENWFLFKTQSDNGAQRVLARLLPPDVQKPLLAFRYIGEAVDTRPQEFPDLMLSFLGKDGKALSTHRVSGNVSIASELAFYSLYLPKPAVTPASVEVRFADQSDVSPESVARFPWKQAIGDVQDIKITVPQIFRGTLPPDFESEKLVVSLNGKPIPFKVQADERMLEVTCPSAPGVFREFLLVAPGYRAERMETSPFLMDQLEFQPGCTLSGEIVGAKGTPVAGAVVRALHGGKLWPTVATADKDGLFELPGLPSSSEIQLLIAPPEGDGMFLPVTIGAEKTQKLDASATAEKAARIRGVIRQPNKDYTYTRAICTGPQGAIVERVEADGSFDMVLPPGQYLSVVARGPDLQTQRRLVDLMTSPTLNFEFELKPSAPAILEFIRPDNTLASGLSLAFNPRDGNFLVIWFGLADGRFVLPNPPDFGIPVTAFSNSKGGSVQYNGFVEGPGTYKIESGRNEALLLQGH